MKKTLKTLIFKILIQAPKNDEIGSFNWDTGDTIASTGNYNYNDLFILTSNVFILANTLKALCPLCMYSVSCTHFDVGKKKVWLGLHSYSLCSQLLLIVIILANFDQWTRCQCTPIGNHSRGGKLQFGLIKLLQNLHFMKIFFI